MASNNRELLGTENVRTLVFKMAGPTIIAQIITSFYNIVDTYFVSQLGTNATAAVGVNSNLERSIFLIATLVGGGAGSFIARLLGRKSDKEAYQVLSTCTITLFASGILIAVLGKIFLSPIVDLLGATPDCKQYSMEYGSYVLYAAPFMITSAILNMSLRSEGSSAFSMFGMGFGGILNCVLDPIFIFKLNMGVAGASIATAISKAVSFSILIFPYLRKKTAVKLSFKYFKIKWRHIVEVVSVGMSGFMRTFISVFAMILLNRMAGSYSTQLLASLSVASRIMMFPFAIVLGYGMGLQPVIGYNWGAEKIDRVKESFTFSMRVAVFGSILMGGILFALARPLIGLFNAEADEFIFTYGSLAIRAEALGMIFHCFGMMVNSFYAGTGKSGAALILSMARQGYCFVPLLYIIPKIFGPQGLCYVQGSADFLSLAITIPLLIRALRLIKNEMRRCAEKTAS